ncbi:MAG: hypothetical protein GX326_02350 [Clostridiaceae bacterium]|nr:hypothetical protein [Clostridiaceae bacterium]
MEVLDFLKENISLTPELVFKEIKTRDDFSDYSKSEGPYYMQPEGKIYTVYMYDFYFKNGDCISYTVKEFAFDTEIRKDGEWSYFSSQDDVWYVYKNNEFVLSETNKGEIKN